MQGIPYNQGVNFDHTDSPRRMPKNDLVNPVFESIWDDYCCRLLNFIRGRVSDEAEAEDLLQEVFIRVHDHLCCLPQPEKMDGWIYTIARNLIIDSYRRRHETSPLSENLSEETESTEPDASTTLALSLKDMVLELPDHYRDALLMTEYQGLSQVDLAGKLGLSVSAAKSRVQRAREKLRVMLLACCHFELDRRGRVIDYHERCHTCNPTP
jgi:RNA polymerase sigma-70 factor, ECF subfamily